MLDLENLQHQMECLRSPERQSAPENCVRVMTRAYV